VGAGDSPMQLDSLELNAYRSVELNAYRSVSAGRVEEVFPWLNMLDTLDNDVIHVLVGDSSHMGSHLLADALRQDSRFQVVNVCSGSQDLLRVTDEADVAIVSAQLDEEPLRGFEVCRRLRTASPNTAVIMLLDSSKRESVVAAFGAGARGVFCRAHSIDTLRKCICSVHSGQIWANSNEMLFVLEAFANAAPIRLVNTHGALLLSKREQDVVRCVTEGLTNRQIAARLKLSEHTVKNYIFRIFDKLGVSTRVEMVLYAFSQRSGSQTANAFEDGFNGSEEPPSEFERHYRAADDGVTWAQLKLGEMYREGQGIEQNEMAAYAWFLLAERVASKVMAGALAGLDDLGSRISPHDRAAAEQKALEWIRRQENIWQKSSIHSNESEHNEHKRTVPPLLSPRFGGPASKNRRDDRRAGGMTVTGKPAANAPRKDALRVLGTGD